MASWVTILLSKLDTHVFVISTLPIASVMAISSDWQIQSEPRVLRMSTSTNWLVLETDHHVETNISIRQNKSKVMSHVMEGIRFQIRECNGG